MKSNRFIDLCVFLLGTLSLSSGQIPTTTPDQWPPERGLIATFNNWFSDTESQIRHFPGYPGYEEVDGELEDGVISASVPKLMFPNPTSYMESLGVDYRKSCIYMYDRGQSAISMVSGYNKDLQANRMEFHQMHAALSKGNVRLAVDWLSHTVYWTDPGFRWIVAAPGLLEKIDQGYYKIIVRSHLDIPHGIALDPVEGLLCWSDNGIHPKIECSDLMGRGRSTVISDNLKNPSGITADVYEKRLIWFDSYMDSLVSVPYSGGSPESISRIRRTSFFEMDVFRDILYVTDTYNGYIYSLFKRNGSEAESPIEIFPYDAYGIAVYGDENQPLKEKDHCLALNCDHICITEKYHATCVCSEGYVLNEATGKCEEYAAGYHKAVVVANTTHICLTDVRAFVETGFSPKCIFTIMKHRAFTNTAPPSRKKRQVSSSPTVTEVHTTTLNNSKSTVTPPTTKSESSTTATIKTTTTSTVARTRPTTTTTMASTTQSVSPGDYITKIDMDMENRIIFFATADNTIYKRAIDQQIDSDAKELIIKTVGNISGLAYDAEDPNNLYWCESDTGHVWVVNTVTRSSTKITQDNSEIKNATNIIILLNKRMLAMIAGARPYLSIQTMTVDGREIISVVSGRRDIAAFAYDIEKELIFYISSLRLYYTSLDGTETKTLLGGLESGIYSLVLYQNYVAWVSQNGTGVGLTTRDLLQDSTRKQYLYNTTNFADMKILDSLLQTPEHISPCAKDNGGCSHICITHYENGMMTPICKCRMGYRVENVVNCTTAVVEDDFILVSDWTNEEILQISLATNEIHIVPGSEGAEYMGVIFDSERKRVVYAEYFDAEIISVNLNGTDRQLIASLGHEGYAYRFDIDRTSGNLYFTAYYSTFIGIVTPSGEYKVLNDDFYYSSLNSIVVHPEKGWMYYAVISYGRNFIGRANMDGTEAEQLTSIPITDDGYPDGLAIDFINDRLFWSDSNHDTIQGCNLDGLECVTIVNVTEAARAEVIRDIATDGEYLYYSSYMNDYIVRVSLEKPYTREIIGRNYGLGRLDTISYYSSKNKNVQPLNEACRDRGGLGDCSSVCLPTSKGRTCACEAGVSLKPDGRTCSNIYQCKDILYQIVEMGSGEQESIEIVMDRTCSRYLDSKCNYKCPVNFEPNFDTHNMTCTEFGWNLEPQTLCKEVRCPIAVKNGKLANTCTRQIGEKCDYRCNAGFVKSKDMAVCTKDGTFHVPNSELCAPYKCDSKINHGSLDPNCPKTIGSQCNYTCDKLYTSSTETMKATCNGTGWVPASTDLCKESMCGDSTLLNGAVLEDCKKKIGDACMFQCETGFKKTASMVFCKKDQVWHPPNSCTPVTCNHEIENGVLDPTCTRLVGSSCSFSCNNYYASNVANMTATCEAGGWSPAPDKLCDHVKCPSTIPNGEITGICSFTIGTTCNFTCNEGYTPSDYPNVLCAYDGKWFTDKLCLEPAPKKFELSQPGVISGLVILIVLLIVLVVVLVFLFRRKKTSSSYSTFDNTSNRGSIVNLGNTE